MLKPPFLQDGDKVAIIAPAGRIEQDSVYAAKELFERWGYEVVLGKNIFNDYRIFSANDEQRAQDLQEALNDEDIRAVFCARGGYGCIRIVDDIDYSMFQGNPKWLVGFSDITVLHAKLNSLGIESIHGPMPVKLPKDGEAGDDWMLLKSFLEGKISDYSYSNHLLNRKGICRGELIGGNLSIIYSLPERCVEWKKNEKILFIEDVGENLYHLDRMMQYLKLSGKLEFLAGLIVGEMTEMKDSEPAFGQDAYEIIADAVKDYNYPVIFDFPAGHGDENYPLLMGAITEMSVDEESYTIRLNSEKHLPGIKDMLIYKERLE